MMLASCAWTAAGTRHPISRTSDLRTRCLPRSVRNVVSIGSSLAAATAPAMTTRREIWSSAIRERRAYHLSFPVGARRQDVSHGWPIRRDEGTTWRLQFDDQRRADCEVCVEDDFKCIEHAMPRSEEHTSELQSRVDLVCRLLLEKKKKTKLYTMNQDKERV